jgi:Sec-independent protein secretion pathway component TatC
VLVQASQFYRFAATVLLAMGLVFQVPVAILAATRAGIVTTRQLRRNRRYAIVACAAVAAFLPGDFITLLLETLPLYLLYELSILLAMLVERSASRGGLSSSARSTDPDGGGAGSQGNQEAAPKGVEDPAVQRMIDHVDRELSD